MKKIEDKIARYINKIVLDKAFSEDFNSDTNLLERGILDSMEFIELILYMEKILSIDSLLNKIEIDNALSINALAKEIRRAS